MVPGSMVKGNTTKENGTEIKEADGDVCNTKTAVPTMGNGQWTRDPVWVC